MARIGAWWLGSDRGVGKEALGRVTVGGQRVLVTELNSSEGRGWCGLDGGEGVWVWWCKWKRRGLWGRRESESEDKVGGEDDGRETEKVKGCLSWTQKI